jgi:GTP-binding protein
MAKFVDLAKIELIAGNGGNGIITFRREKYVDKGGPDGGDGGDGASIYFIASTNVHTLIDLKYKKIVRAPHGTNGARQKMTGRGGKDFYVEVPLGTQVFEDTKEKKLICDLIEEGQVFLIAEGGTGGRGNAKFKTARTNAPSIAENGNEGAHKIVILEIKVLADVGFVGLPSVGKSTLLSKLTNAKPKVADYDFTTLTPQLGIAKVPDGSSSFVIADLPGLIEGASLGKGLGLQFLKHIERCKIIVHMLDGSKEIEDLKESYKTINDEIKAYGLGLEKKDVILVVNKIDMIDDEKKKLIGKEIKEDLIYISGLTKTNLEELLYKIKQKLEEIKKRPIEIKNEEEVYITFQDDDIEKQRVDVKNLGNGMYSLTGP